MSSITTCHSHLWPLYVAFRYPNPLESEDAKVSLSDVDLRNPTRHVYSRYSQQVSTRAEHILIRINLSYHVLYIASHQYPFQDGFAVTYSSGLAASYSVCPERIFRGLRRVLNLNPGSCLLSTKTYSYSRRLSWLSRHDWRLQEESRSQYRSDWLGFRVPGWRSLLVRNACKPHRRI